MACTSPIWSRALPLHEAFAGASRLLSVLHYTADDLLTASSSTTSEADAAAATDRRLIRRLPPISCFRHRRPGWRYTAFAPTDGARWASHHRCWSWDMWSTGSRFRRSWRRGRHWRRRCRYFVRITVVGQLFDELCRQWLTVCEEFYTNFFFISVIQYRLDFSWKKLCQQLFFAVRIITSFLLQSTFRLFVIIRQNDAYLRSQWTDYLLLLFFNRNVLIVM
jgi:hypothetical protein